MTLALPVLLQLALGLGSDPYVRSRVQSNGDPALWPCLWWGTSGVQFDQSDLGNPVTGEASFAAVSSALASWQAVMSSCGSLNLSEGARLASRSIGYDPGSSANPNLILFRTRSCSSVVPPDDPCLSNGDCGNQYDCWPYGANVIALTTTHFKIESGQILHADIELNAAPRPYGYYFTTADAPPCTTTFSQSCVAWDIQATMTHEFGHSLGLDHTSYSSSMSIPPDFRPATATSSCSSKVRPLAPALRRRIPTPVITLRSVAALQEAIARASPLCSAFCCGSSVVRLPFPSAGQPNNF